MLTRIGVIIALAAMLFAAIPAAAEPTHADHARAEPAAAHDPPPRHEPAHDPPPRHEPPPAAAADHPASSQHGAPAERAKGREAPPEKAADRDPGRERGDVDRSEIPRVGAAAREDRVVRPAPVPDPPAPAPPQDITRAKPRESAPAASPASDPRADPAPAAPPPAPVATVTVVAAAVAVEPDAAPVVARAALPALARILAALFARLGWRRASEPDALREGMRARILALVRERPGLRMREIARALETTPQNASYHLRLLEKHSLVRRVGHAHYATEGGAPAREAAAAQERAGGRSRRAVLRAIVRAPGVHVGGLARELGLRHGSVSWAVRQLADAGLVEARREGILVRCYPRASA